MCNIIIEHLVLLYWHCLPGVDLGVIGVVSAKEQRRSLKGKKLFFSAFPHAEKKIN